MNFGKCLLKIILDYTMNKYTCNKDTLGFIWYKSSCWIDTFFFTLFFPEINKDFFTKHILQCSTGNKNINNIQKKILKIIKNAHSGKRVKFKHLRTYLINQFPIYASDIKDNIKKTKKLKKGKCIFPFKYKNTKIYDCIYTKKRGRWCSTENDKITNKYKKYGFCLPQKYQYPYNRYAFVEENDAGSVVNFLNEFFGMFNLPHIIFKNKYDHGNISCYYIVLQNYKYVTIRQAVSQFRKEHLFINVPYLIIESRNNIIYPSLSIKINKHTYILTTIICLSGGHFVAYIKCNNMWYVYDSERSLYNLKIQNINIKKNYYQFYSYNMNGNTQTWDYVRKYSIFFYLPEI